MTTGDAPSTLDLLAEKALARLAAAQDRGEDLRPHIVATYESYARNSAEQWWVQCHPGSALESKAPQLAEQALRDLLNLVADLNLEAFGKTDRVLDRQCTAAVRRAFHDRVRELRAGWAS